MANSSLPQRKCWFLSHRRLSGHHVVRHQRHHTKPLRSDSWMVKPVLSFPAGQLAETLQTASSPGSSVAALFSSQDFSQIQKVLPKLMLLSWWGSVLTFPLEEMSVLPKAWSQQIRPIKAQSKNLLGFVGHMVWWNYSSLGRGNTRAAYQNKWMQIAVYQ